MSSNLSEREVISRDFNILRLLQKGSNIKTVAEIQSRLGFSRTTADKRVKLLVDGNVITKKLTINSSLAAFIGISVSYHTIEISVIGLDGEEILWKDISDKLKNGFNNFNGKIKFDYSISEFIDISNRIKELIQELKLIFNIKAICFAFDYVDLENETFSFADYFSTYNSKVYHFSDFCKVCFNELEKDISFFIDYNAMCQLISRESPMLKRKYNSLYVDIAPTGCFGAVLSYNAVRYGYKMQSLNLSGLLQQQEKRDLEANNVTNRQLLLICKKLLEPLIISLSPEQIVISGETLFRDSNWINSLMLRKSDIIRESKAINYNPKIEIMSNFRSKGAAILAMYRYYYWDYTCI